MSIYEATIKCLLVGPARKSIFDIWTIRLLDVLKINFVPDTGGKFSNLSSKMGRKSFFVLHYEKM